MHIGSSWFLQYGLGAGDGQSGGERRRGQKRKEEKKKRERVADCEGDEFLSATISAPGFPLVDPKVNNWCRDKSVSGDSKTVRQQRRGGVGCESQTTFDPPPPSQKMPTASSSHAPPCPLSMALWRMMALRALEVQICVLTCSCTLSACFPLVSGDRAHRECSGITDTPVTLPNRIMETYWFFFTASVFLFLSFFPPAWR